MKLFVFLLALSSAAALQRAPAATDTWKPNIILIYSDDVGIGDIGCCGGPFKTPNIDKLAEGGTRFEHCYSTPLCGPSRCQTLTGRYPFRTGLNTNNSKDAVSPDREVMIPTVMKKAGYATASVGKWGQICLGPREWGFDEHLVFPGSGRYWRAQTTTYNVNGENRNLPEGKYLPDIMHDFAADFIARHKDQPFFLYYPMSHIHGPIVPTPDSPPGAEKDRLYADNIEYMDKLVGKLAAELDRLHLREKTVILFTGDNGTAHFGADTATVDGKIVSGKKATMLEGGSRVPLVVNWPGTTPAGKVNKDLVDFSDFFSTFAELGGTPLPEGVTLDSHSFAPQIKGDKGTPREWAYVELGGNSYARDARYKLTNKGGLFDLKNAPWEEIPVPSDTKDEAAIASRAKLQAVLDDHPAKPKGPGDDKKGNKKEKRRLKKENRKTGPPDSTPPATTS
ncbi:MAG: sulfatase-like hydrolase/transferase [Verrucomicrobiota bacterium]